MAGVDHKQYRPISTAETSADDALSVGAIRDLTDSINNTVRYVMSHMYLSIICVPVWASHDSTAQERVIAVFAPPVVPEPFTHWAWIVGGRKTAESAGSDEVTWTLYCSSWSYSGDGVMDTTELSADYTSSAIAFDSTTHAMPAAGTLEIARTKGNRTHLVLTAKNDNTSTQGYLSSIAIWPIVSA